MSFAVGLEEAGRVAVFGDLEDRFDLGFFDLLKKLVQVRCVRDNGMVANRYPTPSIFAERVGKPLLGFDCLFQLSNGHSDSLTRSAYQMDRRTSTRSSSRDATWLPGCQQEATAPDLRFRPM